MTKNCLEKKSCVYTIQKLEEAFCGYTICMGIPELKKTMWHFYQHYHTSILKKDLCEIIKNILEPCKTCCEAKPNNASDRGTVGALPIPQLVNEILYIDFVQVDEFQNHDYVMTVVDGLSRFARFVQCRKTINAEKSLQLFFEVGYKFMADRGKS